MKAKEVNLGDEENCKPVFIMVELTHQEETTILAYVKDMFAWSYEDMT